MAESKTTDDCSRGSRFMATRWSIVLAAGGMSGAERQKALEELARAYWFPLYSFIRRKGHDAAQAEDLTQGFFSHLLEKKTLAKADRERGKFRSFLLASLKNYISDEWDKSRRLKRGGGAKFVALDATEAESRYSLEPADPMTPERLFERKWALTVLSQVMNRLEGEYQEKGQGKLFEAIKGSIAGSAQAMSYVEAAKKMEMTQGAVKMAAHRLRKRYREILRDEISQTVASPELIDEEIRFLMESL